MFFKIFIPVFYKKIIAGAIALVLASVIDIFWFKCSGIIKTMYLNNDNIRYKLEVANDTLKLFWQIFPFMILFIAIAIKKPLYKKVSINNLIHFLSIVVLVLTLKFITGKARPLNANSPFDYNVFRGYITKDHDSFPSGETAIAFVQALYIVRFVKLKFLLVFFSILTPVLRLALYRHWWFDCVFSILLSATIINLAEKIRKKYDYNKKSNESTT